MSERGDMTPATAQHRDRTREQVIELALAAMSRVVAEESIPADVRRVVAHAHARLHAERDAATVAAMERKRGLRQ